MRFHCYLDKVPVGGGIGGFAGGFGGIKQGGQKFGFAGGIVATAMFFNSVD